MENFSCYNCLGNRFAGNGANLSGLPDAHSLFYFQLPPSIDKAFSTAFQPPATEIDQISQTIEPSWEQLQTQLQSGQSTFSFDVEDLYAMNLSADRQWKIILHCYAENAEKARQAKTVSRSPKTRSPYD